VKEDERIRRAKKERRLDALEKVLWGLAWLLACMFIAELVALVWVVAHGNRLDADMDAVAASLGGG
jgi:hypothetical protein